MKRTPGTFANYGNNVEFTAVSRAHKDANVPAYVIADAISNGTLRVHQVNGCKCVLLADLLRFKEGVSDD